MCVIWCPKMPKEPWKSWPRWKMGYTQFESYGGPDFLWGMTPKECKTFLGEGVKMVSTHFDMNKDLDKNIERGAEAGLKYMLCPYLGPQKTLDAWKQKSGIVQSSRWKSNQSRHEIWLPQPRLLVQTAGRSNSSRSTFGQYRPQIRDVLNWTFAGL